MSWMASKGKNRNAWESALAESSSTSIPSPPDTKVAPVDEVNGVRKVVFSPIDRARFTSNEVDIRPSVDEKLVRPVAIHVDAIHDGMADGWPGLCPRLSFGHECGAPSYKLYDTRRFVQ